MPSSTDAVSLVPRSSTKSSKKHRPGFRPITKSSNKKKTAAETSTKEETKKNLEPSTDATDNFVERPSTGQAQDVDATEPKQVERGSTPQATVDNDQNTTTTEKEAGIENETDFPSTTNNTSKIRRTPPKVRKTVRIASPTSIRTGPSSSHETSSKNTTTTATTTTTTTTAQTSSLASQTTLTQNEAMQIAPLSPRRSTRKRKPGQSSIRIGSTREVSSVITPQHPRRESEPPRKETEQNSAVEASKSATTVSASTAIVPIISQDQAILERLNSENAAVPRLAAFCSKFKIEKTNDKKGRGKRQKKNKDRDQNEENIGNGDTTGTGLAANDEVIEPMDDAEISTSQQAPAGVPVVQIIDGEIVLQESSLMLPTRRTVQEVEEEFQDNVVEEDAQMAIVQASYTSFLTKGDAAANGGMRGPQHWSLEETHKFYMALRQLGTDFGSMEALFDGKRTRRQLKQKYRKELAKTPNLVQELALNPKYKTDLDLSAFDVEVDPKRIEALENEEPPPYEPTDVEHIEEKAEYLDEGHENGQTPIQHTYNTKGEGGLEIVYEDAMEEHEAELAAATASSAATLSQSEAASSSQQKVLYHPNQNASKTSSKDMGYEPLWPTGSEGVGLADEGARLESFVDGFVDNNMGEPSMEDFFDDQMVGMGDGGHSDTDGSARKDSTTIDETTSQIASHSEHVIKESSDQVSLVPKKIHSSTKSRRPKIRPASRKKKTNK
ncbi:Myb-like DNA-binding protein [Nitzschia inconspicua]|uniref:Myb-like DNA-binding protein n=1 Tax=Nitzschia inconspicua TaxID=303405 RepID=A0A9K3LDP4_9STRA|nr:Myb-like DNA-binding protein [Nitzschia inconspicua]